MSRLDTIRSEGSSHGTANMPRKYSIRLSRKSGGGSIGVGWCMRTGHIPHGMMSIEQIVATGRCHDAYNVLYTQTRSAGAVLAPRHQSLVFLQYPPHVFCKEKHTNKCAENVMRNTQYVPLKHTTQWPYFGARQDLPLGNTRILPCRAGIPKNKNI